ncbi:MAG: methanethiol S-methyltransferase [Betaproteobacteria bacterium]
MFKRMTVFLYGVFCYVFFFATFLYAIGFIGNLWVPRSMDSPSGGDVATNLVIDVLLLLIFSLQHSVMARPAFKRWWTRFIPEPAERSTYVLLSSLALVLLFALWRPLGGLIWSFDGMAANVLYGIYAFGWLLLLASTFAIDHFDLFGLRQIWLYLRDRPYVDLKFKTLGPYRLVRHPIYVAWLLIFWATPVMTATHLLFAIGTTTYILLAIRLEEKDLVDHLGDDYRRYRERVPGLIPFTGGRAPRKQPGSIA